MTSGPVIIRLSVENMQRSILAALSPEELAVDTKAAIEKAVSEFDFDGEVHRIVKGSLGQLVQSLVQRALYEAVYSPEIKEKVVEKIKELLGK